MESSEVEKRAREAFEKFSEREEFIIFNNTNERSLTHRFAIYLEELFPEYDVDCEYNRHGTDIKKISEVYNVEGLRVEDIDAKTVYPDIIVHKRGNDNNNNLLIIEVKKSNSKISNDRDISKLNEYISQLKYKNALFIVIDVNDKIHPKNEFQWIKKKEVLVGGKDEII